MESVMKKLLVILLLLFSSFSIYAQDTIRVPTDYPTIQQGINAANNNDIVLVAEGTYFENVLIENKAVTLASYFILHDSTSYISNTIINGSQPINTDNASVITVRSSQDTTVICGFTITGGYGNRVPVSATEWARVGGGVCCEASNLLICNNRIIENVIDENTVPDPYIGGAGGGIGINPLFTENLSVVIRNNLISNNYIASPMTGGGGIAIKNFSGLEIFNYLIEDNIISNNTNYNTDDWKAMGGGISLELVLPAQGLKIIRNNIISNNQAICENSVSSKHSFGGGMYIVITETSSDGSVDNDPGPYIYNNIISGNHSDYLGGGVAVWRAYFPPGSPTAQPLGSIGHYTPKPSFLNNTIVNNTAQDGSGFFIMNHIPFLMNNILWNQVPQNAVWGEIFLGDEPQWTAWVEGNNYGGSKMFYNDVKGGWDPDSGEGNINFDPMFEDTLFNLSDSSYCVGNGTDSIAINGIYYTFSSIDFNGNVRPNPIDSYIDNGAKESPYERNQVPVSVKDNSNELPVKYSLQQNYPNPFNPSTKISWQSPVGGWQTIKLFDVLGNEIATLVDEYKSAGKYEIEFDAAALPSGVYFYQLKAGEYINRKKMILLK
jgi:hypothetical protein